MRFVIIVVFLHLGYTIEDIIIYIIRKVLGTYRKVHKPQRQQGTHRAHCFTTLLREESSTRRQKPVGIYFSNEL